MQWLPELIIDTFFFQDLSESLEMVQREVLIDYNLYSGFTYEKYALELETAKWQRNKKRK